MILFVLYRLLCWVYVMLFLLYILVYIYTAYIYILLYLIFYYILCFSYIDTRLNCVRNTFSTHCNDDITRVQYAIDKLWVQEMADAIGCEISGQ